MDIDVNNLPSKIKDDCLLDAMVNLHFQTEYNQDVIEKAIGEKINSLEGSKYARYPVIERGVNTERNFYANDKYRIMVFNNTISFNIVKSYPKWEPYKDFIKSIIVVLLNKIVITNVDVHYISHFGNIPLFKNIDGAVSLTHLNSFQGAQYSFQCLASDGIQGHVPATASVILTDRREYAPGQIESTIDISVANIINQGFLLDDVINSLDFVHICQKHLFFTIISNNLYEQLKK